MVGGVVGLSYYNINNCYATGNVSGSYRVGGLVGAHSGGSIINCYATGDVEGTQYIGGLIGQITSSISISTNTTVATCYAQGNVRGDINVGGLVGEQSSSNGNRVGINNCYATGDVEGAEYVGGLIGKQVVDGGYMIARGNWNTDAEQTVGGAARGGDEKLGIGGREFHRIAISYSVEGMTSEQMKQPAFVNTLNANRDSGQPDPTVDYNTWYYHAGEYPNFTPLTKVLSSHLDPAHASWSADVKFCAEEAKTASVILAVYDQDTEQLLHIKTYNNQQIPTGTSESTFSIEDLMQTSGIVCKLFVWSGFNQLDPMDPAHINLYE